MTIAARLIAEAKAQGVTLYIKGDKLAYLAEEGGFSNELKSRVVENKELIRQFFLDEKNSTHLNAPFSQLTALERESLENNEQYEDIYPLAALQAGMVFHTELEGFSGIYHDIAVQHIRCEWNEGLFREALDYCIARHPILRTHYYLKGERPLQLVLRHGPLPLEVEDIRLLDREEQAQQLKHWVEQRKTHVFDWQSGPLYQINIFLRSEESFQFIISFHHSVLDGWSRASFSTELYNCYERLLAGATLPAVSTDWTYRDFIASEQKAIAQVESIEHFRNMLHDAPVYQLPRLPDDTSSTSGHRSMGLPKFRQHSEQLLALSKSMGVPIQSILLAAHLKVLSTVSGHRKAMTCMLGNGRPEREGAEQGLGLFFNSLPLALELDDCTWRQLIERVSSANAQNLSHRLYPLSEVQKHLGRDFSEVMFYFTHFHVFEQMNTPKKSSASEAANETGRSTFEVLNAFSYEQTNFDLLVSVAQSLGVDEMDLNFVYNTQVYSEQQIKQLSHYYLMAFDLMLMQLDTSHQATSLLSASEQRELLAPVTPSSSTFSPPATFLQSWSEQVNARNTQVAVRSGDESWCYGELEEQANRVANWLSAQGVQKGDVIGVCLERSLPLMSHLLGCLKVGAAYLPLDPSYPEQRLQYMLSDSQAQWVLVDVEHPAFKREGVKVFNIASTDYQAALFASASEYRSEVRAGDLAYLIYTSGSTGQPKGVMVSHGNVANFLMSMQEQPGCQVGDRLLAVTPISFDIHVLELFLPLISGAEVVLCRREDSVDGARLSAQLAEHEITMMQATPMTWRLLLDSGEWPSGVILKALCGGERLAEDLASRLLERVDSLWNMYGPTETTVWSTCARLTNEGVSIGYPIANTQCYVLSESRELLPRGVSGELYIGGAGVTQGYWQREALTAERYCDNPFVEGGQERMYRTGDRVRYLADGRLHYEGRVDEQVKLRGQRIEPGEIESVLVEHEGLRSAVVTIQSGAGEDDGRLVAYVVLADKEGLLDEGELAERLRDYLEPRLPLHLIPSAYAVLEALPLTPNGKVDKRALPAITNEQGTRPFTEPSNETEQTLVTLLAKILARPDHDISTSASFFELGGHSLMAMRFANEISQNFNIHFQLTTIFHYPTIKQMALEINNLSNSNSLIFKTESELSSDEMEISI
ncbi:amino acid adenylation domain-containing protein [Pleionea litopenaei]|uniref:Amino acid adenylation domain-containing protein n=1 Tax=Pleionea litopenaei TaxID=3070815 RepID=A0AA51RTH2_9GAMM|nr:amino acid adenylation domain-containing protein [Pleionea sp. HL-JVS1]WMS87331.1 amino acid adenylation domain-containing protein [Pleionea sp. HL-JVS1]